MNATDSPAAAAPPVLLVVDVTDSGRDDDTFDQEARALTARILAAATDAGFRTERVAAEQVGDAGLAERLARADALLVTGGEDVDPTLYGGDPTEQHLGQTFPTADRAQITAVQHAVEALVPVIGICRGMQLVNVALGGTLVQHLTVPGHVNHDDPANSMVDHAVTLDPDSVLAQRTGSTTLTVRSSHHQAVREPGAGLRVVARADDGTIEAVEHESAPVWCVQWHPEDEGSRGTVLADLLRQAAISARSRRAIPGTGVGTSSHG
ncbi:gamma-glutamyl-gamma-aminobutyrate hydrolase family protein [Curtobacterium ammoniigenes]|uniref:gamma-glutamyl-gamma-aminobutyrate hydrolase family protein n=1 Tax=Curtobacterium ammoniigenes TaxID=395387 RepID=UPI00083035DA|nr:gamma-glutamyl-gamma-aminobutyrate hydrolase family protein [Curtobacterium ammoniigenes]